MKIIESYLKPNSKLIIRNTTNEIILHCTASPEGNDWSVESIDRFHKSKGWSMIGYHYIIYRDGSIHRGRPENAIGAHTVGHNANSIGVCYVGGVSIDGKTPKDTRTDAQKASLIELVAWLMEKYPGATIHGHREFANKACPSFDVQQWVSEEYEPKVAEVGFKCNLK
jgi:N-acetylmuramoyl-L-alanine amidase